MSNELLHIFIALQTRLKLFSEKLVDEKPNSIDSPSKNQSQSVKSSHEEVKKTKHTKPAPKSKKVSSKRGRNGEVDEIVAKRKKSNKAGEVIITDKQTGKKEKKQNKEGENASKEDEKPQIKSEKRVVKTAQNDLQNTKEKSKAIEVKSKQAEKGSKYKNKQVVSDNSTNNTVSIKMKQRSMTKKKPNIEANATLEDRKSEVDDKKVDEYKDIENMDDKKDEFDYNKIEDQSANKMDDINSGLNDKIEELSGNKMEGRKSLIDDTPQTKDLEEERSKTPPSSQEIRETSSDKTQEECSSLGPTFNEVQSTENKSYSNATTSIAESTEAAEDEKAYVEMPVQDKRTFSGSIPKRKSKSIKSKIEEMVAEDIDKQHLLKIRSIKPGLTPEVALRRKQVKKFRKRFFKMHRIKRINNKAVGRMQGRLCERYFFKIVVMLERQNFSHLEYLHDLSTKVSTYFTTFTWNFYFIY